MGVGDQRHSSAALLSGKRTGTHCIGRWVGTGVMRRWNNTKQYETKYNFKYE
jgi:hypothetical protein